MKGIRTSLFLIVIIIMIYNSCTKKELPVLTTSEVFEITYNSAISGGDITNDGGDVIISRGLCWNTYGYPKESGKKTSESGGKGSFTGKLTELNPNTTYYVRAYATNSVGTAYGNELTFLTSELPLPVVTTSDVTDITSSGARSGGNITDNRGLPITSRGICWSTSSIPMLGYSFSSITNDGTSPGNFASSLSSLEGNTTYYVRAYATNELGTGYGEIKSFKTLSAIPTVATTSISNVTQHTCLSGGKITYDGGYSIKDYGVCWSTSPNPNWYDKNSKNALITNGTFTSTIFSLSLNTTYYIRAYARNEKGTGYGNEITLTTMANPILFNADMTYGSVTDIEGNIYKTIELGSQVWMAENLKTQKYSNGDVIGTTKLARSDISKDSSPKYQWVYDSIQQNLAIYGRLYTWHVATDSRNVCPIGWHVPTQQEWLTIGSYLGADGKDGGRLKENGLTHWNEPNTDATNETGFTSLPAGWRSPWGGSDSYNRLGQIGDFWTSTEASATLGTCFMLDSDMGALTYSGLNKAFGLSIRCLKD